MEIKKKDQDNIMMQIIKQNMMVNGKMENNMVQVDNFKMVNCIIRVILKME